MNDNKDHPYQKYVYWLETVQVPQFKAILKNCGLDVFTVRKAVCIPLSTSHEVTFVPPEAFEEYQFCRRQLSWYQPSPFFGQTLLVSSQNLHRFGLLPETIISEAPDFSPPVLPQENDIERLTASPVYLKAQPRIFADIEAEGPEKQQQWLNILKLKDISFEKLFRLHQANHANFMDPAFFVQGQNEPIPYSLNPTARVCSACLEFFNIIGARFHQKMVVPCPGAVLFARLKKDCYYRVISPGARN